MRNRKVATMTLMAMFIALMTVMTFVPQIGFIEITPVIAFTLLHIPVLVGAYLYGWKYGIALGLLFGFLSWLRAMISPMTYLDPFFVNPAISILPRLLFGLAAGAFFELERHIVGRKPLKVMVLASTALVLTFLHSAMVLTSLGIFNGVAIGADLGANYWALMGTIIGTNGVSEAIVAFLVVPAIALPIERYVLKRPA